VKRHSGWNRVSEAVAAAVATTAACRSVRAGWGTRAMLGILGMVGSRPTHGGGGAGPAASHPPISPCLSVAGPSMVARIGFSATTSRESRQGRKAAAAASMSGAGARAGASCLPGCGACSGWPHRPGRAGRAIPPSRAGRWRSEAGGFARPAERHRHRETGGLASAPVGFIHELYRAGA